jgi:hypothetical protein
MLSWYGSQETLASVVTVLNWIAAVITALLAIEFFVKRRYQSSPRIVLRMERLKGMSSAVAAGAILIAIAISSRVSTLQDQERKEFKQQIANLQTKPLKVRIVDLLRSIGVLEAAQQQHQREFGKAPASRLLLTDAQRVELQELCKEDSAGTYIKWWSERGGTIDDVLGVSAKRSGIAFSITDEVLK